jgi:hypothetical protein
MQQLEAYRRAAMQQYRGAGSQLNTSGLAYRQWSPLAQSRAGYQSLLANMGLATQTGARGIERFMDPYQSDVIAGIQRDFDRQRGLTMRGAADAATAAGAYGGNRSAILQAIGMRDVGQQESDVLAQYRSGGYTDALNRLLTERSSLANMGLAGMQGLQGVGAQDWMQQMQALQMMQGGIGGGGYTTTSTEEGGYTPSNPFLGALGGAATGYGMFGGGFGGNTANMGMQPSGGSWVPGYQPNRQWGF